MRAKRRIAYGVGNWAKLVRDDAYFYVDHTAYIRELEKFDTPVFLRPRRFGKTMWCSLLECYYDVKRKDDFGWLFGKTEIGKNPTALRNSFLILRLNFSLVEVGEAGDLGRIERSFNEHVTESVDSFAIRYRAYADFSSAAKAKTALAAIRGLRKALCDARAKGKKVPPLYLIIDEYDNFMNQLIVAKRDGDYEKLVAKTSFLKNFFKAVKAGVEEDGVIGKTYITGVLPVVLDDLTSGFNIAKMVNLRPELLGMLGFTQRDVDQYVDEIYADYGFDPGTKPALIAELKALYDSYRFQPSQKESIYNSTILNYYLDEFINNGGTPPWNPIDMNVRTDVSWLERLTGGRKAALEDIRDLVEHDGRIDYSSELLDPHVFTKANFFEKRFFVAALYYLGLLTYDDKGVSSMKVPNLTMKRIFLDYYETLSQYYGGKWADAFSEAVEAFGADGDWTRLFAAYWKNYVGRIPARSFGNLTEAFFQLTFCDLCWRNLSFFYTIHVEPNLHSGLADFVAYPVKDDGRKICIVEFKYAKGRGKRKEGRGKSLARVTAADKRQVAAYARDVQLLHPTKEIEAYVCSIVGNRSYALARVKTESKITAPSGKEARQVKRLDD